MSDTWRHVLSILADGQLVSGSAIGAQLGISRTAVWKHLNQLQDWGIPVQTVKGQGYQIEEGMELLSSALISKTMSREAAELLVKLELLDHIDSTNSFAREALGQGFGRGYVCMAEHQSQGRGRLGRQWVSPFGRNIYLSATWVFEEGVSALEGLSLAVGVAVCRALQTLGVPHANLKWPNDILVEGRKVGGILLEMFGDPVGPCQVVVGIGVNFAMPPNAAIDQPWADLGEYDGITRNGLAGEVLSKLLPLLSTYSELGFQHYRQAWETFDAHRGLKVRLTTPSTVVEGIALGVTGTGAICLEVDGVKQSFNGGEISLRSLE